MIKNPIKNFSSSIVFFFLTNHEDIKKTNHNLKNSQGCIVHDQTSNRNLAHLSKSVQREVNRSQTKITHIANATYFNFLTYFKGIKYSNATTASATTNFCT